MVFAGADMPLLLKGYLPGDDHAKHIPMDACNGQQLRYPRVQRHQTTPAMNCQAEEIGVRDLPVPDKKVRWYMAHEFVRQPFPGEEDSVDRITGCSIPAIP